MVVIHEYVVDWLLARRHKAKVTPYMYTRRTSSKPAAAPAITWLQDDTLLDQHDDDDVTVSQSVSLFHTPTTAAAAAAAAVSLVIIIVIVVNLLSVRVTLSQAWSVQVYFHTMLTTLMQTLSSFVHT